MAKSKFSNQEKYEIVKKVLTSDLTVTEACKLYGISSAHYYRWQDQFLKGAKESFESVKQGRKSTKLEREKANLEVEVTRLKNVVADLAADCIELKKKTSGF